MVFFSCLMCAGCEGSVSELQPACHMWANDMLGLLSHELLSENYRSKLSRKQSWLRRAWQASSLISPLCQEQVTSSM